MEITSAVWGGGGSKEAEANWKGCEEMRMSHDEMIAVIQASKDGKRLQRHHVSWKHDVWMDDESPNFDFVMCSFRIKPPKPPRDFWICECVEATPSIRVYQHENDYRCKKCKSAIHVREVLPDEGKP